MSAKKAEQERGGDCERSGWEGLGEGGQERGGRPEITHIPVFELPITPIARIRSQGIDQCSHCPLSQFLDLLYRVNRTITKTKHA